MPHATTQVLAGLSRALRRSAAALGAAAPRARRGEVKAIHRLRVATRRLREAVPAAASAMGEDADRLVRDLRRVTKGVGTVRELDVALSVLWTFAAREAWPAGVVARLAAYCERLREREFGKSGEVLEALDARAARRRLMEIADRLEASGNKARASAWLASRVRECSRALVRDITEAGTLYAPVPLHRVRIATKKLRYVLELAGEAAPDASRRLKRLQSALGRMHDAQVLQHRILELSSTTGDRAIVSILTSMDRSIETSCRAWHAEILKDLPRVAEVADEAARVVPHALHPKHLGKPVRMAGDRNGSRRTRIA